MEFHIHLDSELTEHASYAIIAGDPGRIPKIAALLDNPRPLAVNREYTSWIGYHNNVPVVVISHGIGGPSTAICVEELAHTGIKTLLRVGTSGGMNMKVLPGDVVIVNGAIRQDGTSKEYAPIEYPAIADFDVTLHLKQAAEALGLPHHVGVVQCKDSFYGQHSPESMPIASELLNKWEAWLRLGTLCSEMETATLFTVAACRGLKAGGVMQCIWNQERTKAGIRDVECHDTTRAVTVGVEAICRLIDDDCAAN